MPNASSTIVALAVSTYPGTAQLPDVGFLGYLSAAHLGTSADVDVYVSFDGTNDHWRLRGGSIVAAQSSQTPSYRKAWVRLASGVGPVNVHLCIEEEGRR